MEAAYVGSSIAMKDLKYVIFLLGELEVQFSTDIVMDCQSALSIVNNQEVTGRTKHLDTGFKFVWQEFKRIGVVLKYVPRE
eukprot:snap_masked-scaffold_20-processed-gene-5.106-mRNA-1 protein AED:1.00 eAED:1.00 QI:0/-1/0/0/-1/1/1/0/80